MLPSSSGLKSMPNKNNSMKQTSSSASGWRKRGNMEKERALEATFSHATCSVCCLLHAGFLLGLLCNSKVELTCSSETSLDFQRATPRCISEDRPLQIKIKYLFIPK
jgi:hypothetical protein